MSRKSVVLMKSVDSNFCTFWFASVTREHPWIFTVGTGVKMVSSFRASVRKRHFSDKYM